MSEESRLTFGKLRRALSVSFLCCLLFLGLTGCFSVALLLGLSHRNKLNEVGSLLVGTLRALGVLQGGVALLAWLVVGLERDKWVL